MNFSGLKPKFNANLFEQFKVLKLFAGVCTYY